MMARSPHRHRRRSEVRKRPDPVGKSRGNPWNAKVEAAWWIVLFAAAIGALLWDHRSMFFHAWNDEQIHYYVAHRMAEGARLYRDIDSARPPLVLYPLEWLIRAGISPLGAGRAIVLGSQIATAGLLLWGGWRLASRRAGGLAALLFLTSPEIFARVHYTGIQLVALSAFACVLAALRAQPFRAGIFFGLSLATDQHAMVICGVAGLATLVRRRRDGLIFALGAFGVSAIVFGGVWALGGRHMWRSLVGIHLFHLQPGEGISSHFWELLKPWLYEHVYLFAGAALAIVQLGIRRTEPKDEHSLPPLSWQLRVLLLAIGAHVAVVLAMTEAAFLYLVVMFPLLALLAGMGFDATGTWWHQQRQSAPVRSRGASRLLLAGAVAVVVFTAGGWSAARSHREELDERQYSFWPHVLHVQLSRFHEMTPAVRWAADQLVLPKGGTIFGDPTIVSLLALQTDLRVSGELADLNPSWVEAGAIKPEEIVSRIEADHVGVVISPPAGLLQDGYFKSYLLTCYQRPSLFSPPEVGSGSGLPSLLFFRRIARDSPCLGPALP
jgi:hypothetical protein